MVEFSDIVDAIVTDRGYHPVASGKFGIENDKLKIDNNQSFLINIHGDSPEKPRNVLIYKYNKFYDDKEVKYVIRCAGHEASINVSENPYGGIEIRNTLLDRPHGTSVLYVGFCDEKYLVVKYEENKEEYELTKDPKSHEEIITAEEWSVDRILDELLRGVMITWDEEEWKIDSKMIFDIIKPALRLSILNEKEKWINYLSLWEDHYQGRIKYDNLTEEQKNRYIDIINKYSETISILESKQELTGKKRK